MPSKKRLAAYVIIAVLVVVFAVLPAAMAYLSLHPPRCKPAGNPASLGLSYENVSIDAGGITLSGWLIEPAQPEREEIFVVMHGYTSCKASEEVLSVSAELARRGYRVLAFDFRAHGESGGSATTIGPLEAGVDARSSVDWLASRYPGRPIVLMGFSMGAVAAIMEGADDPRVSAIVADSPYPLLSEVVPRWLGSKMGIPDWYSRIIGAWGSLISGEPLDYGPYKLGRIPKPLIVIVGTNDPLVKPAEADRIASESPCGLPVIVPGAGHIESYKLLGASKYVGQILEAMKTRLRSCRAA